MKTNSRLLALLFSILVPGMGQLYNSLTIPGVIIGLTALTLTMAMKSPLLLWGGFPLCAILFLLQMGVVVASAVQATRAARSVTKRGFRVSLALYCVGYFAMVATINELGVTKAFNIPSGSMVPNILKGDRIIVNTSAFRARPAKAGEIAVFLFPKDNRIHFVKRVLGLAGDRVAFKNKRLFLNGKPVPARGVPASALDLPLDEKPDSAVEETLGARPYLVSLTTASTFTSESPEVIVPSDSFYVAGDNRDYSSDSRHWGFVNQRELEGKPAFVWWSWDAERVRVRWERIGKRLD